MERGAPSPGSKRRKLAWRLALGATLGLAALVGFAVSLLFSGSEVACAEAARAEDTHIRCAFVVAAPPEVVWAAFTTTDVPRAYYFDAVLEAEMRPLGRWRFVTEDRKRLLAGGKILTLDPPHRFAHTFAAADLDDAPSRITVELEAIDAGSHVVLVHDRFSGETRTYRRFRLAHPLAFQLAGLHRRVPVRQGVESPDQPPDLIRGDLELC